MSSFTDSTAVPESVATSLGVTRNAAANLPDVVGDTHLLLVIDNADHVVAGVAPLVQDLLIGCPNLRILVTSRERLNVGAETCWRLPTLRLPPAGLCDPAVLLTYDGVELFNVRAGATAGGLTLTS